MPPSPSFGIGGGRRRLAFPVPPTSSQGGSSVNDPHATSARLTDSSTSWLRAGALSGFAFTLFLALAWFLNGAETPHYLAPNHDWTTWANNTEMKGRFAAFFALLAGLTFLPFAATV